MFEYVNTLDGVKVTMKGSGAIVANIATRQHAKEKNERGQMVDKYEKKPGKNDIGHDVLIVRAVWEPIPKDDWSVRLSGPLTVGEWNKMIAGIPKQEVMLG
jgi:hypothetical protein